MCYLKKMHNLTISFLIAASEMLDKINDVIPTLAHQLGVLVQELFYLWMCRRPELEQKGIIKNTNWSYFFNGFECDLDHTKNYRHLRVEFVPNGTIDTFSGFAVLEYVMASCSPWPEYKELKKFLASKDNKPGSPSNYLSGYFDKMCVLEDELCKHKFVEVTDPELCKLSRSVQKN